MKSPNALNAYFTSKALQRINLTKKELEEAKKLIGLFEHDNRVNFQKIREELFGLLEITTANNELNRFVGIINKKAEEAGIPFKCYITGDEKTEAAERWVWFEGTIAMPNAQTNDLNGLEKKTGGKIIEQKAYYGDSTEKVVVILTFNLHEKDAMINKFLPISYNVPSAYPGEIDGLNLGEHGGFRVVLLHCPGQGSTISQQRAYSAWNSWKPVAVCSVGIGYGAIPKKEKEDGEKRKEEGEQNIGDVLISEPKSRIIYTKINRVI